MKGVSSRVCNQSLPLFFCLYRLLLLLVISAISERTGTYRFFRNNFISPPSISLYVTEAFSLNGTSVDHQFSGTVKFNHFLWCMGAPYYPLYSTLSC